MKTFFTYIFWALIFLFVIFRNCDSCDNKSEENKKGSSNTTQSSEAIPNNSNEFSGNHCAVCGNPCKKDKEIPSSGDAVSNYEPYYICGENMDCVYERERQNKELGNSNQSDYNALDSRPKNDYEMGSDGRVYDTNPCSLCEGDGIEGFGDNTRICPMCDGKGRQSY
jgi:hypothetical protein